MTALNLSSFRNKRILLLQGPVGPFFRRLAHDLRNCGAQVWKVNFNGGDRLFYRRSAISFRGAIDAWPAFLEDLLERLDIDMLMLFGDCRAYHAIALDIARRRRLEIGVFEEGYVRPDYVTLEREGVNGYSRLPADPACYSGKMPVGEVHTEPVGDTFWHAAGWACFYYLASDLLRPMFPHYRHHRPLTVLETVPWLGSLWRKAVYNVKERGLQGRLAGPLSKRFFLVPLQVHNDSQVHIHSDFRSVEAFIRHVVSSFAHHAPDDTVLLIKHHPMDRGYSDYAHLLQQLCDAHRLGSRLLYAHDLHLPSLLQHARGVVVINSTVGMSALFHKAPLIACGDAIYNIEGLTYQGRLDCFWREAEHIAVDSVLFEHFRTHVIESTQVNGSFYKRLRDSGYASGMRWDKRPQPGKETPIKNGKHPLSRSMTAHCASAEALAPHHDMQLRKNGTGGC